MSYYASVMPPETKVYQGWSAHIQWCKEHCINEWVYEGEGVFRFETEQDNLLFLLKWTQ